MSTTGLAFGANDSFRTSNLISVKPRDLTVVAAFVYIFQSYRGHCARRVCSQIAPSLVALLILKHAGVNKKPKKSKLSGMEFGEF